MSSSAKPPQPLNRTLVPSGEPPRPYAFPAIDAFRLSNGLRVLCVRQPAFPIVTVEVLTPAGGRFNPLDRPGLADIHSLLLQEGTRSHNSSELASAVEQLGGALDSGAGWNAAYCEMELLSASFDHGLGLLAEMVFEPTFPEEKLEWLRERASADLLLRPTRPRLLADDVFSRVVYGGSVYGFPLKGTPESVGAFVLDELWELHRRSMVPGDSTLVVAGDVDPDRLRIRAEELFGSWEARPSLEPPVIEPAPLRGIQVHIADRPGAAQTQLQVGHVGVDRRHPEYYKLIVLNVLLGGKFTSRLNLNLRERHGFTYGVQSNFARRLGPGPFSIKAAVATDVAGAAVREILFELRRLCTDPIPAEELQETLDYLLGVFPYTVQTTEDLAARLENLAMFDLPLDYYDIYPRQLRSLRPQDLEEAARSFVYPEDLVIVAVGPAEALRAELESFGPVTVHGQD